MLEIREINKGNLGYLKSTSMRTDGNSCCGSVFCIYNSIFKGNLFDNHISFQHVKWNWQTQFQILAEALSVHFAYKPLGNA